MMDLIQPGTSRTNQHATKYEVTVQTQAPEPSTSKILSPKNKKSVFRKIENITQSPRKMKLISLVKSKESQIRQLKKLCRKRKNDIKSLTSLDDSAVVRNLFAGMSQTTSDFLISQLRCAKRSPRGRRWTVEEKAMALALYKRSPSAYNFLRKLVALPSKRTILALLEKVPFETGINEHIFHHINDCISTEKDRFVALLFDEIDIKENLQYDKKKGRIYGFEDYGFNVKSRPKHANKALVFMVCGLGDNKWKQPIAYYFSSGGCSSKVIKGVIEDVLLACQNLAKLEVVTTICDMGTPNVKAVSDLGATAQKPFFYFNGKKVFVMFDPPHLLKRTASLFRQYDISIEVEVAGQKSRMEARFEDIRTAYKIDCATPMAFRSLHKIKQDHLAPKVKYSMKVNIAAQIMSHSVAAYIYTLTGHNEFEERVIATATFVQQVNDIFDSVNGNRLRQASDGGNLLRCRATAESGHMEFWAKALEEVQGWEFQRRTKTGLLKSMPPCQKGWITSLNAIMGIWEYLKSRGFDSLKTRSLNQDPLENTFGNVRAGCGRADNPTAAQFISSLKTQIINGLSSRPLGGNCEEDEASLLSNLHNFLRTGNDSAEHNKEDKETVGHTPQSSEHGILPNIAEQITDAVVTGQLATLSVAYVSGFVCKFAYLGTGKCPQCANSLMGSPEEPHNVFIQNKEFSITTHHLIYPSVELVVAIGQAATIIENFLNVSPQIKNISSVLTSRLMSNVSFEFIKCEQHKNYLVHEILKATINISIPWWCKRKNCDLRDKTDQKKKIKKFKHI
ncbi:hypothetical protein ABEB36_014366 [Hypothenemus hampei]|uniref:Transposable element P transposase n=1 Tax=Hypothenemus hampei TaxID=57062 RepID=A0ABD1E4H0_HYPHA